LKDRYTRVARLKTGDEFLAYLHSLGVDLPFDQEIIQGSDNPLAQPFNMKNGFMIGNRFCVLPMEGWDGATDGNPTELVFRRWRNFGRSGAKLIWGGEAFAVRPSGRANPNQLMILDHTRNGIEQLKGALVEEHRLNHGNTSDLYIGMQLTHSGRFSRPNEKGRLEPIIAYHHPLLDQQFNIPEDLPVITDLEIADLIEDYVLAAKRAQEIGFDFVDIKHCHGYLGHEFLSAVSRQGNYGGSFENRTRFLREIVSGIKTTCPGLTVGVRFSMFDMPPSWPNDENVGVMQDYRDETGRYRFAFGGSPEKPGELDLTEPRALMDMMDDIGVELVNFTASSPYYNPHLIRPAYFPPSDGYLPPEDPLVSVARQINAARELNSAAPEIGCVGSAYSYLQEYIPHVAQAVVREKMIDFVGLGRSMLSYPELPSDILKGKPLQRKKICRTFSDCTTAPRKGLVSGCYPLDDFYKNKPEAKALKTIKKEIGRAQ
jgi:NADPH2 dehydrogenase